MFGLKGGREGLSPDVGGALRLWRTHEGDNYCFRAGAPALEGRPALPHGRREGRADAGGARLHAICFNSRHRSSRRKTCAKLVYRFANIVLLLYDTDKTGLECSEKHRAQLYGVKRLALPLPGTKAEKGRTTSKPGTRGGADGAVPETARTRCTEYYWRCWKSQKVRSTTTPPRPEQPAVAIVTAAGGVKAVGSEENYLLCITGGEGTGKSNAALVAGRSWNGRRTPDLLRGWSRLAGVRYCCTTRNRAKQSQEHGRLLLPCRAA